MKNFIKGELIGLKVKVTQCSDPSLVKNEGILIDENTSIKVVNILSELFVKNSPAKPANDEISKVEEILIELARLIGLVESNLATNVIYVKTPRIVDEIKGTLDKLYARINSVLRIIKANYFNEVIREARTGLEQLSSSEEMRIEGKMKIKGMFRYKKGADKLDKLADRLNLIE